MNFNDLNNTLREALATGKIGTPVSLRVHLQLPDAQFDLALLLTRIMQLAEPILSRERASLMARRDAAERQLSVLLNYAGGQTAMLTVGRGSVDRASLHLLLFGNHGIVRLEGAELFDDVPSPVQVGLPRWKSAVDESLAQGEAVPVFPEGAKT